MKKSIRIIIALVSLSMIAVYFLPLWAIFLDAPQYPEGLGMTIWLSSIGGDLGTINGLNHYIGMKTINPDSIPELTIMPYLLAMLITGGLITALTGKRWVFVSWVLLFLAVGVAGGMDFYLWEYDYGHDLNPHAAIKVPGMNYQPPFIGSKQLLNFYAYSYPQAGGWFIILSGCAALVILLAEFAPAFAGPKKKKSPVQVITHAYHLFPKINYSKLGNLITVKRIIRLAVPVIFIIFAEACTRGPVPIKYGKDICSFCKMTIADSRFGSELVTKKNKIYKFDSAECLIDFLKNGKINDSFVHGFYVSDFLMPSNLIDAATSWYLVSEKIQSPMGAGLASFSNKAAAEKFIAGENGNVFSWTEVQSELRN